MSTVLLQFLTLALKQRFQFYVKLLTLTDGVLSDSWRAEHCRFLITCVQQHLFVNFNSSELQTREFTTSTIHSNWLWLAIVGYYPILSIIVTIMRASVSIFSFTFLAFALLFHLIGDSIAASEIWLSIRAFFFSFWRKIFKVAQMDWIDFLANCSFSFPSLKSLVYETFIRGKINFSS